MITLNILRKYFALPLHLRTWIMTEGCMVINLILAAYHLIIGFIDHSDLMLIMGFFYTLLAFMRFFLGKSVRTFFKQAAEDRIRGTLILSGMLMVILSLILNRIFTNMSADNQAADFTNFSTLLMTVFALSKIVMTGYGLKLSHREKDPIFSLVQRTTLVETIFCSFSLWLSLIPFIPDPSVQDSLLLNSGNLFSGFVFVMGVINIWTYKKYNSSVNLLNIPTYDEVNSSR